MILMGGIIDILFCNKAGFFFFFFFCLLFFFRFISRNLHHIAEKVCLYYRFLYYKNIVFFAEDSSSKSFKFQFGKNIFKNFYIISLNPKIFFMKLAWNFSNNGGELFTQYSHLLSCFYFFSKRSFNVICICQYVFQRTILSQ